MPLSYPLSLADFQDVITISERGFSIRSPRKVDRTASGVPLTASLGEPVWRGSFSVPPTNNRSQAARIDTLLSVLDRAGSTFLVYDPAKPYPAMDPDGSLSSATSPTIRFLDATDARLVGLEGIVSGGNGFQIKAGDYIGWTYTVNGDTRYALHQAVEDATPNGVGNTQLFEVTPFIQPGVVVGDPVTMVKPPMKAVLEPDPSYGTARAAVSAGPSFSFVQSLR